MVFLGTNWIYSSVYSNKDVVDPKTHPATASLSAATLPGMPT